MTITNLTSNEMKPKLFKNMLLFSLFGIALGFFGILYEGVVFIPKMLDHSMARMLFWKNFYDTLSPIPYYIPLTPLATITLVVLYFTTANKKTAHRNLLGLAGICQLVSLAITFCMVTQINPKLLFNNPEKYAEVIPAKIILVNILSVIKIVLAGIALAFTFKAYMFTQKEQD